MCRTTAERRHSASSPESHPPLSSVERFRLAFYQLQQPFRFPSQSYCSFSICFNHRFYIKLICWFCDQVSAGAAMLAVVYMRAMLPESVIHVDECLIDPSSKVCSEVKVVDDEDGDKSEKLERNLFRSMPSFEDMISLLKTRLVLKLISVQLTLRFSWICVIYKVLVSCDCVIWWHMQHYVLASHCCWIL